MAYLMIPMYHCDYFMSLEVSSRSFSKERADKSRGDVSRFAFSRSTYRKACKCVQPTERATH